jgi:hypothetical protein
MKKLTFETPEKRAKFMDIKDYEKVLIEKVKPFGITGITLTKAFLIKLTIPEFPYNPYIKVKSKSIAWSSKPL